MTTKSTADRIRVEELAFPFSYTNYLGVAQPEKSRSLDLIQNNSRHAIFLLHLTKVPRSLQSEPAPADVIRSLVL